MGHCRTGHRCPKHCATDSTSSSTAVVPSRGEPVPVFRSRTGRRPAEARRRARMSLLGRALIGDALVSGGDRE